MSYLFKDEFSTWIEVNKLTRKETIALLQKCNYEEFKGLDTITLSRWLSGKTTPVLYKQLYIAKSLGVNLIELIKCIDCSNLMLSAKNTTLLNNFRRAFDSSLMYLSYELMSSKVRCNIELMSYNETKQLFGYFNENISALTPVIEYLDKEADRLLYTSINLLNDKDQLVGHWAGLTNITALEGMPYIMSLDEKERKRSIALNVGHFKSSAHFLELIIHAICYYLLALAEKKDTLYILIAGPEVLDLSRELFGAERVKYYPPLDERSQISLHLMKVDIIKAISNPAILPLIQKKLACLEPCDGSTCNMCNLYKFKSTSSTS